MVLDVSRWSDSSEYSNHMLQTVGSKQPAYNSGAIRFVSADVQSLQTAGTDIELSGHFYYRNKIKHSSSRWSYYR